MVFRAHKLIAFVIAGCTQVKRLCIFAPALSAKLHVNIVVLFQRFHRLMLTWERNDVDMGKK